MSTGCSLAVTGKLVESPAGKQKVEVLAQQLEIIGPCDPEVGLHHQKYKHPTFFFKFFLFITLLRQLLWMFFHFHFNRSIPWQKRGTLLSFWEKFPIYVFAPTHLEVTAWHQHHLNLIDRFSLADILNNPNQKLSWGYATVQQLQYDNISTIMDS